MSGLVSHLRDIARVGTTGRIHVAKKNTHRSGNSIAAMTGRIGNAAKRDKKMLRICHAGKVDDVLAGIAADRATDYAAGSAQRGPARGNHYRFLTGKFFTSQIDSRLR